MWSNNPAASQIPYERHHLLADAQRVPTILVDPRRTSLAEAAAVHLRLRPGTDGALALGLAHVILVRGLENREFLLHHAHGFEEYEAYVKEFTPRRTSEITGIPEKDILKAAELYGRHHPAQITISANARKNETQNSQQIASTYDPNSATGSAIPYVY